MNEKEAIESLKDFYNNKLERDKLEINYINGGFKLGSLYKNIEINGAIEAVLNLIEKQQTEIEKKHKIIDLMAEQLVGLAIYDEDKEEPIIPKNEEEVIEYFNQKIEKGE